MEKNLKIETLRFEKVDGWFCGLYYVGFIGQNLFVLTKDFRFSDPDGFEDIEGEDISSPSIRYVGVNLKVEF